MISFFDELYNVDYHIICSKSINYAIKKLDMVGIERDHEDLKDAQACTVFSDDMTQIGIIFFIKPINSSVIVHECLHACAKVLQVRGIPLTMSNDETLAYYLELIYNKVRLKLGQKVIL